MAEVGFGMEAIIALATFGGIKRNDMVANGKAGYAFADFHDYARALMAEDGGE